MQGQATVEVEATWPAQLELTLGRRGEASRITRSRHLGPLYVQKPFYPEGPELAHVYLLHPPGGVVSGDDLQIRIDVQEQACALVTTPGAGRFYRARNSAIPQVQQVALRVAEGGSLEWFPQETIVFDGACAEMATHIELAAASNLFAWEITCFGLPASGEPFQRGNFSQRYTVTRQGRPLFTDQVRVDDHCRDALLQGQAGLAGQPVTGFFLAGPVLGEDDALLQSLRDCCGEAAAISRVGEWYIGRYLGPGAEAARKQFIAWWQLLRPELLGRAAHSPRIWAT